MSSAYRKSAILVCVLVSMLSFSSCATPPQQQYTIDALMTVSEILVLREQYVDVVSLITANRHRFTSEELIALQSVQSSISLIINRFDAISDVKAGVITITDIKYLWVLAADSYVKAQGVVIAHWTEFSPVEQMLFEAFDQQAILANTRITQLLVNPQAQQIDTMMSTITTLASIAATIALTL